ncbi:class I SAM-dependent methyltransferase [Paraburkholderia hayleyella]|uniref:class I SAM-dependent methyltransferase n=1 Tax=Paraburkholderia hayleyella TaxID=2152889 RepID=UPI0012920677|nr:class I SAM-dependent methyltransferase [Paraburkholderia hayleyella]
MVLKYDRSIGESCLRESRIFPMVPHKSRRADVPPEGLSGNCPVCGVSAVFNGFTDNERESGACSSCGSSNRQRQIATVVRAVYQLPASGPLCFGEKEFSIYNTESGGPLHSALKNEHAYVFSEYFGTDVPRGSEVQGIRNEDLQDLTFDNASFDLVISSDVLEHMPRPYDAHREIYRVLKPGGRHIFTVPFYAWEALDERRAVQTGDNVEYFGEKLYHGDPVRPGEGILVWTIFGLEMLVELSRMGFIVSYWNLQDLSAGIIGPWSIVFEARRPAKP